MINFFIDMINFFIDPYKKYDGNWRGFYYYDKMRLRKEYFKFWVILIICFFVLFFAFEAQILIKNIK